MSVTTIMYNVVSATVVAISLPLITLLAFREIVPRLIEVCFPRYGEGEAAEEAEVAFDWVSSSVKLLSAFISFIIVGVAVFFIFRLHDVTKFHKYVCSKAPNPYSNYTVDLYRFEEQRLTPSMWSDTLVHSAPTISIQLLCTFLFVKYLITSPEVIAFMKFCYTVVLLFYTSFVVIFQEHYESDCEITANFRSLCMIVILTMLLCFMAICYDTQILLNRVVFAATVSIGFVLAINSSYNGFHVICGEDTPRFPGYLVSQCLLVIVFSIFNDHIFPHAALTVALLFIPPICPFLIALTAWSLDTIIQISTRGTGRPLPYGQPTLARFPGTGQSADEDYANRREGIGQHSTRRSRRERADRSAN